MNHDFTRSKIFIIYKMLHNFSILILVILFLHIVKALIIVIIKINSIWSIIIILIVIIKPIHHIQILLKSYKIAFQL